MGVVQRGRAAIYDAAIVGMTAAWYQAVLARVPPRCRLLDIGIGTGSALLANSEAIVDKQLRITGVDVDAAYVARCNRAVARGGLTNRIEARHESIYDHRGGPYDAAYFSASFMLLPDPPAALRHVRSLLADGSPVYFTQTFEHARSRAVELVKPLLRLVTTIDFGRVTYESDFRRALAAGGLNVEEMETLHASPRRSAILAVGRTRPGG
jgi:SAM-dependent methyltransferase